MRNILNTKILCRNAFVMFLFPKRILLLGDFLRLLRNFLGSESRQNAGTATVSSVGERVTPAQYRVRGEDATFSLPFTVSKFVDFGGTRDRSQINTMSYVALFLYKNRPEWFPRLAELQPVPRGLSIKQQVGAVGKLVYEKGINDLVFKAYLRESETIEGLIKYLESATNRRTLYSRKW